MSGLHHANGVRNGNINRPPRSPAPAWATIPLELTRIPRWVNWKYVLRGEKWTKPPYQPDGSLASSTDPATWSVFEHAQIAYETGEFDGIGIVLNGKDGLCGWDFDHCVEAERITDLRIAELVNRLNSYTEISPSGTGLRVFIHAILPPGDRKVGAIECYESERYLTVTGRHLAGTPHSVNHQQAAVNDVHAVVFAERIARRKAALARPAETHQALYLADEELLEKARTAKNGSRFNALYNLGDWKGQGFASQSEADQALCNNLAFWTSRDPERIDRLFQASGLMREKWNRSDYRESTINKAIDGCAEVYSSARHDAGGQSDRRASEPSADTKDFKAGAVDPDVARLARLSPLEYGKCRKAEAKKMGVPVSTLDGEVEKARKQYQAEHPEPKVAPQWTPMPQSWTEVVHGQELIAELVSAIRRFVMLDESAALIVALWILFTWVFEGYAETNPYLRVISAAPGCGKSTLLKVLRWLARSGWLLARISPSSFARTMDKERRTLLLDEGDAFLHENEVMRNLLDGASDPDTATISLAEKQGDNWQPIELNVFVPVSIASIGALRRMETVEDRSIAIHLKRATGVELKPLDKGRRRTLKAFLEPLALKCAKWATDNASALKGVRPELPDTMLGREQDKWEPLIGVADALGNEFGILARKIAIEMSASRGDDGATVGVMLIADLQGDDIFGSGVEFVSTVAILEELHKIEHRPWPAYGRAQKPISAIQLARLLKPFSVSPASNGTTRGYKHSDLADVFIRHPAHTPIQPVNPSETSRREGESEFSDPSRTSLLDGSKNRETPWESKATDTLTDKNAVNAEIEAEIDRLAAADVEKGMDDREDF